MWRSDGWPPANSGRVTLSASAPKIQFSCANSPRQKSSSSSVRFSSRMFLDELCERLAAAVTVFASANVAAGVDDHDQRKRSHLVGALQLGDVARIRSLFHLPVDDAHGHVGAVDPRRE